MAFAPDGRLFVCEQGGRLRVIKNGALLSTPFLTVSTDSSGERGLLGVAFDPDFDINHWIYVYYTATSPSTHNRVSRFTANGDVVVPGSEVIILELNNLSSADNHNGGAMHFGDDGKLYIAVGENANPSNAQTLGNLLGKMLRINADGSIPTDNPFFNTATGVNRAIWALGLRNPFTFSFQPGTGRLFINDVGQDAWEEINDGIAGSNYGWPTTEGTTSDPRFRSPLFVYGHGFSNTTGCAITGGAFYNPDTAQFPLDYVGDYFFADYCSGWIRRFDPASGTATGFATGISGPVDLKVHSDGSLYYLAIGDGGVYRIRFTANQAPSIGTQPVSQIRPAGSSVTFTVSASGTAPLAYQWQRNGTNISGATSSSYTLGPLSTADSGAVFRVVVSNAFGTATSNGATLTVTNNTAPTATITSPGTGTRYRAGDTIQYAGTGSDPEDGSVPASRFTWEIVFHHDTHTHPFMPPTSGATSGSFTVPTTGHTESNVWYRIHLTVQDSVGATATTFVDVLPQTVTLQLATNPAGLQVTLDGQPMTTPVSVTGVVGIVRTLGPVTPQTLNGTTYEFVSWSDGGAATHTISTPATSTQYVATYQVRAQSADLVAAYSFDEGTGPTANDISGRGNTGLVAGATWTTQGRFGNALSFDGANDWVAVNDSASLDLTSGLTLEAWVFPTASTGWRTVMLKEQTGQQVYALYASSGANTPAGQVYVNAAGQRVQGPSALPVNTWTHLATTYDGAIQRLYVNGVQVASRAQSGPVLTSTGALRVGGNNVWGEFFQGRIDEVRIYSRALAASEIQADMNTPIGSGTPPPPPSFTLTVTKSGSGSGTVTGSTTSGVVVSCGSDCGETLVQGTQVSFSAAAAAGSTFSGWSGPCSGTGSCTVTISGNTSLGAAFTPTPPPPGGLVAAYSFDEGTGPTVNDVSGRGNTGSISGATWTTQGRFGSALSFDGVNDWVVVNDAASLDLTTGLTLEAWVFPTSSTGWRTVVLKEQTGQQVYALYASSGTNTPAGQVYVSAAGQRVQGPSALPVNTWTHLATTYDGALQRLYVNGVQVASRAQSGSILTSTGALRIGGNNVWGEFFQGRIDEVRIYSRALAASEIQADMNTAVSATPSGAAAATVASTLRAPTAGATTGGTSARSSSSATTPGAKGEASAASLSVVHGTVSFASGAPVAFPNVFLETADGRVVFAASTDEQGHYTILAAPAGAFRVIGQDAGSGLTAAVSGQLTRLDTPVTADIQLPAAGTLVGRVVRADGTPVASASVALDVAGVGFERFARTDAQGVYRFADVVFGPVSLRAGITTDGRTLTGRAAGRLEAGVGALTLDILVAE